MVDRPVRLVRKRRLAPDSPVLLSLNFGLFREDFRPRARSSSPSSKTSRPPMRKRSHQGWNLSNEDRSQSQSTPSRTRARTNWFGFAALGSSVHGLVANWPDGDCGFRSLAPSDSGGLFRPGESSIPDRTSPVPTAPCWFPLG
jgi:hypothetical protein